MFEKEAKKWVKENTRIEYSVSFGEFPIAPSATKSFTAGAEFGYNKAKEEDKCHYPSKGELPKCDMGSEPFVIMGWNCFEELFIKGLKN